MPQLPVIFLAFANDKVDEVAYLRNLPKELDNIRQALYSAQQMGLCEVVERANATIGQVVSVFQEPVYKDRIAIFHYGGHATEDKLLLESLDGGVAASSSEGLVPFLARQHALQLVFINGCSSEPQALEMIEAGIPAVIGTSRAINDTVATQLSTRFYKGLAAGLSLEKAWSDATDEAKMGTSTGNYRGLYYKKKEAPTDQFPWNMVIREGAEKVKEWNLPQAAGDTLFGLPPIPPTYNLPEEPFLFFRWYQRPEAEVFFGRGAYIRDLYHRVVDRNSPPLVLLYGQSGVGKSSLFDAGLRPRLELTHEVVYIRRDPKRGLVASLMKGLSGLSPSATNQTENSPKEESLSKLQSPLESLLSSINETLESLDTEARPDERAYITQLQAMQRQGKEMLTDLSQQNASKQGDSPTEKLTLLPQEKGFLFQWLSREAQTGQPLVIILDQVEEAYTRPLQRTATEMDDFWDELAEAFRDVRTLPMGKLILGYRKEYHPEIDDACKRNALPRSQVFLEPLKKDDIMEVVSGLTSTERLRNRYHLTVEDSLPTLMASDLAEDPDSPVAPILQILVTKMWQQAIAEDPARPAFTESLYLRLKQEGILLQDFFDQQMENLKTFLPDVVNSGLALDFLHFHTTRMGTSGSRSIEEIREFYSGREEAISQLSSRCKDLYLLSEIGEGSGSLTHDILAPLVIKAFRDSDLPGQRAIRILENKMVDYEKQEGVTLDPTDLALVEKGENGMRTWAVREQELVRESRIRRKKEEAAAKRRRMFAIIGVAAVALLGVISFLLKLDADKSRDQAEVSLIKANSAQVEATLSATLFKLQKDSTQLILDLKKRTQDSLRISDSLQDVERNNALYKEKIASAGREVLLSNIFFSEGDQREAMKAAISGYANPSFEAHAALLNAYYFSPFSFPVQHFGSRINDMIVDDATGNIVVATEGGEVFLMSPKGEILKKVTHNAPANNLAMHDRIVVSASQDGTLIRWDLNTGISTRSKGLGSNLTDVTISPNGEAYGVLVGDSVRLYDKNFAFLNSFVFSGENLICLAFSPDGKTLAIGNLSGVVRLCDQEGKVQQEFADRYRKMTNYLSFSQDGNWLLGAFGNRTVNRWRIDGTEKPIRSINDAGFYMAAFIDNDRYIATLSRDGTIRILGFNGERLLHIEGKQHPEAYSIVFHPDTRRIYAGANDGSVKVWEVDSWLKKIISIHDRKVVFADWQGKKVMIGAKSSKSALIEWDPLGSRLPVFIPQENELVDMHIGPGNKGLVWAFPNNVYTKKNRDAPPIALSAPEKMVRLGALATGKNFIAAGGKSAVYVWDEKGTFLKQISVGRGIASHLIASPDGRYLMASTRTEKLFAWETRSWDDLSSSFQGINGDALAFHPSGKKVLISNGIEAVEYNFPSGNSGLSLTQDEEITCATYSPDGRLIASGGRYGTWHLWYQKGDEFQLLFTHKGHQEKINHISFSKDGTYIVTASDDHLVGVWPIDPGVIIQLSRL